MIIYGCINGKLKNKTLVGMSNTKVNCILKENNISIKSLPGDGNLGLKKKDLKPYVENNGSCTKLID